MGGQSPAGVCLRRGCRPSIARQQSFPYLHRSHTVHTRRIQVAHRSPTTCLLDAHGDWLGVVPFFLFAVAFIFLARYGAFRRRVCDAQGGFTLANIVAFSALYSRRLLADDRASLVTAVGGGIFGFLVAYAAILGGRAGAARIGVDDLLRRRLQLRRHSAGLRLYRYAGAVGMVTVLLRGCVWPEHL